MTLQFVAQHHNIPVEGIEVEIEPVRRMEPEEARGVPWRRKLRVATFRRHIKVRGPLTGEHKELLLRGAGNCPVDMTLTTGSEVPTTLEVE